MQYKFTIIILIFLWGTPHLYSHPYFVSVTEIHIHPKTHQVDISCSMFTEDLESAIKSIYSIQPDLQKQLGAKEMLDYIFRYIQKRLVIRIGNEALNYSMVGCENQEESTWCYLEGSYSSDAKAISGSNSILFDFLDDQTNMVHVYMDDSRQSTKLNNPKAEFTFSF